MTPEHAAPTQPRTEPEVRPTRKGRFIVAGVILAATAGAFGIARLTFDKTLSPLQRQARAEIRGLEGYFKSFHRITGRFPSQAENFYPLLQVGLIKEIPMDPWGRPYQYRMSERGNGYIMTYGADGVRGGKGDAADLVSGGVLSNTEEGPEEQAKEGTP
ncbi:type II secretion system protein GspG [Melittangium boletus]|uniref:General secretion pathway protein G n=1 Tax=Melittangium boletus DSM 14713 TaxID=1294270 RepID=A0A250I847_9BACT|nr:type II secretion system protein GspG [Melittangium boletus]ATB27370.1 general secretion pathway protein G [Melittangium boletus DSM 14713]